ncbi:hypothetical protein ACES2L_05970 [Bdellovibrio bacteriovorus]
MNPNNVIQRTIESKIDGFTNTAIFFREFDIREFSDEDLFYLYCKLAEVDSTFKLRSFVDFVRDEFADRRQDKLHQENKWLSICAIVAAGLAAIASIIQAIAAFKGPG